jgi:hypothetical protein
METHSHTHDHGHAHAHGHHHHHDHDHGHEDDTYTIDQLCMVGLSGAFGVICLCLFFWQRQMLTLLLGPQFHLYVLFSGVALVFLAVTRGISLWFQAGKLAAAHSHTHDHPHEHEHADGQSCCHDHAHGPHHHDHSHEDHDHGWAPWRYVVLLVPVILFMLGLPNKGPDAGVKNVEMDFSKEASGYARLISLGPDPLPMLTFISANYQEGPDTEAQPLAFKELEEAAATESRREFYKGKTIEVRGQYSPSPANMHVFRLVRFRISCCAADAISLDVPMVCKDEIRNVARNTWVKVSGKVDFLKKGDTYTTMLRVPSRAKVEPCAPDLNPWVQ